MSNQRDHVEIQEPPIQGLKKNRSCLKRSCASGCGCLVVVILLFLVLLKFVATPRAREVKEIPRSFPSEIPIYDKDSVAHISTIEGTQRQRALGVAAYIPTAILTPMYRSIDGDLQKEIHNALETVGEKRGWEKLTHIIRQPLTARKDTIELQWEGLTAEPSFIQTFYETELEKQGFSTKVVKETHATRHLVFTKNTIEGILYIQDDPDKDGTEHATLTVNITAADHSRSTYGN